jgi:hypothetical protein
MKNLITVTAPLLIFCFCAAQSPVGKWKVLSHISTYQGQTFDSQKALLQQRPCAAKIFYEINADGTYRLNAASSGCDEKYKSIQEKLWSKTNWQLKGDIFTTSTLKDFSAGQSYKMTIDGNKMTWVGTDGQGTIVYQKL